MEKSKAKKQLRLSEMIKIAWAICKRDCQEQDWKGLKRSYRLMARLQKANVKAGKVVVKRLARLK